MARCPFAIWHPISGPSGPNLGGPFKIVHHTTEGSSATGAFAAFTKNRSDPHFTVDATTVYQHIDTDEAARALRNDVGGVQTNRDSAVQIELVGFAHLAKNPEALTNLARLCRWIERAHDVPNIWPSGPPKPAKNGKDPGGHNRDATTWETKSGHFGHCHVPENTHWDPAYNTTEVQFLNEAQFDNAGRLTIGANSITVMTASIKEMATKTKKSVKTSSLSQVTSQSTMPDHHEVITGVRAYLRDLAISSATIPPKIESLNEQKKLAVAAKSRRHGLTASPSSKTAAIDAQVNVGSLLSFVDGLAAQERNDVMDSVQLAQRGASAAFDRFTQTQLWYQKYTEILENLGWTIDQMAFSRYDQSEGEFRMDQAAIKVIAAIATGGQLAVLQQALSALAGLSDSAGAIRLFDFHSSLDGSGNFQLGVVQRSDNGALSMALGAFYFRGIDDQRQFLFFKWGSKKVNFWTAAQRMTLNADFYARNRDGIRARLLADIPRFIAEIKL